MRKLVSLFALLSASLFGQPLQQVHPNPDCQIYFTLTASGTFSAAQDNRQNGCTTWSLVYSNSGFSAVSVVLQSAPNNAGVAGSYSTGFPFNKRSWRAAIPRRRPREAIFGSSGHKCLGARFLGVRNWKRSGYRMPFRMEDSQCAISSSFCLCVRHSARSGNSTGATQSRLPDFLHADRLGNELRGTGQSAAGLHLLEYGVRQLRVLRRDRDIQVCRE